jgi:hypothetical protein
VPPIIPKEERKRNPDRAEFEKKMHDIDVIVEGIRTKIRNLGQKKKETLEGGRV